MKKFNTYVLEREREDCHYFGGSPAEKTEKELIKELENKVFTLEKEMKKMTEFIDSFKQKKYI